MKLQVCIDESGDTGYSKKSSSYFVLCAVITDNLDSLRRLARNIHRKKYRKKKGNILHAYAESDELKNKLVKKLIAIEKIACIACVVEKEKIKKPDLYLYATEQLAHHFEGQGVEIIIVAKRDSRKSYSENILNIYTTHHIKATFSDPAKDKSLQIADFYSWSVYSWLEKGNGAYFHKLKDHIQLI